MDKDTEMHTEDADLAIHAFCQDWRRFVGGQDSDLFLHGLYHSGMGLFTVFIKTMLEVVAVGM